MFAIRPPLPLLDRALQRRPRNLGLLDSDLKGLSNEIEMHGPWAREVRRSVSV